MEKATHFYLNKYMIAFYDESDICIGVYDNIQELKKSIGYKKNDLHNQVHSILKHNRLTRLLGIKSRIHLIEISGVDQEKEKSRYKEIGMLIDKLYPCSVKTLLNRLETSKNEGENKNG